MAERDAINDRGVRYLSFCPGVGVKPEREASTDTRPLLLAFVLPFVQRGLLFHPSSTGILHFNCRALFRSSGKLALLSRCKPLLDTSNIGWVQTHGPVSRFLPRMASTKRHRSGSLTVFSLLPPIRRRRYPGAQRGLEGVPVILLGPSTGPKHATQRRPRSLGGTISTRLASGGAPGPHRRLLASSCTPTRAMEMGNGRLSNDAPTAGVATRCQGRASSVGSGCPWSAATC